MDEFNVRTKLWPTGEELDLGTDSNLVTVPSTFTRHAANFVTSMDGSHNYQFLFWNTGRHVTNKRHVRWNFSVGGWGLWQATRWYGTPGGGGPGAQRVDVEPFTIGGDSPITGSGTAIDGPASTFAAGAFPFGSPPNDHQIGTAGGAVDVAAKEPFASLHFAGWLQLIWGGDDSGEFVETDTGASPGSSGFFPSGSGTFHVAQHGSADLLATYGNSAKPSVSIDWGKVLGLVAGGVIPSLPIGPGDPGPDDIRRLETLVQLIQLSRPGAVQQGTSFQSVIDAAPRMSADEVKLAIKSVQTSLDLGKTALSTLQAQLKKGGK